MNPNTARLTLVLSLGLGLTARAQTIVSDAPLSPVQKREIVTIVEDMASEWRTDFSNGQPPNDALIRFGIYQTALRRFELFHPPKDTNKIRLAASHVREATQRYFGRTPRHHSLDYDKYQNIYYWTYRDGSYHGYSESFEQQGVEKVQFIRVIGAKSSAMTVRADFVDGMASATSEPEREVVVKIQMTLRKAGSNKNSRLVVWSFKSLTKGL